MDSIVKLVHELLNAESIPTIQLQQINEELLKAYQLSYEGYLTVLPLDVEIFYVNHKASYPFVDTNMQCMLDPKTDAEIWKLQSNRFGQLYLHKKGPGGIDICLSDSPEYALCCTIKAAKINGTEYWGSVKVRDAFIQKISEHQGVKPSLLSRMEIYELLNRIDSPVVLQPRTEILTEEVVYTLTRRGLRRKDKNILLPLRAFMDLWNKGVQMTNSQKITLYMKYHPNAEVLDVLREQHFRYIPYDVKIRYNIDRRARLYEKED